MQGPRNDNAARRKRVYVRSCIIVISASTQRMFSASSALPIDPQQPTCYINDGILPSVSFPHRPLPSVFARSIYVCISIDKEICVRDQLKFSKL